VIESRDVASGDSIRRRRECETCGHRFTTYERVERPNLVVVKKDGVRVIFDRQKVLAGIERASEKTSITGPQREEIVARIERALYDLGKPEVRAEQIGELVMDELAKADEVAYVRFASVYRHFTSIKSFEEGLSVLKARKIK
jgi:transcriptional repressor NrdR